MTNIRARARWMCAATTYLVHAFESQVLEVDVATESGANQLADVINADFGTIDFAISAIGAWWQKGTAISRDRSPVCRHAVQLQ